LSGPSGKRPSATHRSARFTVTVADGIVTIEGAPKTDLAGRDIIEAARHVEGVVAVRDRLSHPHSGMPS
jgi:osmotically-inducible protein OsmY